MTINDFLKKHINSYKTQISAFKYKIGNYNTEKNNINRELMNNNHSSSIFTKIVEILGIVWMGVMITGVGLGFFGFLPLETFVIAMITVLGGGFASYKVIDAILDKKMSEKNADLKTDRNFIISELDACKEKIKEMEKIIEESKKTMSFFEFCNRNDYLANNMPVHEVQVIEFLKRDFSLISILYLANKGSLPTKIVKDLKEEEIDLLKNIAHGIDEKLAKNPQFFFDDESEISPIMGESRGRNYRSAKYREVSNFDVEIEDSNTENKGHSR